MMEGSQAPRGPTQDGGEQPPPPASVLWADLQALLPSSQEGLQLDFGETVESSVVHLLRQAADLLFGAQGDDGLCLRLSEVILDYSWEKLNIGAWRDVDKEWRRIYTYGCLFKALSLCRAGEAARPEEAMRTCDLGLLMGASILDNLLARVVGVLQRHLPRPKRPAAGDAKEPLRQKVRGVRWLRRAREWQATLIWKRARSLGSSHTTSKRGLKSHEVGPEMPAFLHPHACLHATGSSVWGCPLLRCLDILGACPENLQRASLV